LCRGSIGWRPGTNDRDHAEHHKHHQQRDLRDQERRLRLGRRQRAEQRNFLERRVPSLDVRME
jgi:hypothetical protein